MRADRRADVSFSAEVRHDNRLEIYSQTEHGHALHQRYGIDGQYPDEVLESHGWRRVSEWRHPQRPEAEFQRTAIIERA